MCCIDIHIITYLVSVRYRMFTRCCCCWWCALRYVWPYTLLLSSSAQRICITIPTTVYTDVHTYMYTYKQSEWRGLSCNNAHTLLRATYNTQTQQHNYNTYTQTTQYIHNSSTPTQTTHRHSTSVGIYVFLYVCMCTFVVVLSAPITLYTTLHIHCGG